MKLSQQGMATETINSDSDEETYKSEYTRLKKLSCSTYVRQKSVSLRVKSRLFI